MTKRLRWICALTCLVVMPACASTLSTTSPITAAPSATKVAQIATASKEPSATIQPTSTPSQTPTHNRTPTNTPSSTPTETATNTPTRRPPSATRPPHTSTAVPTQTAAPASDTPVPTVVSGQAIQVGAVPRSLAELSACLIGLGQAHEFAPDLQGQWPHHAGDLIAVNGTQVTFAPAPGEDPPVTIDLANTAGIVLRYQTANTPWTHLQGESIAPSYRRRSDGATIGFSVAEVLSILRPGIWLTYIVDSGYLNIVCAAYE
jgi:hypothetical protein